MGGQALQFLLSSFLGQVKNDVTAYVYICEWFGQNEVDSNIFGVRQPAKCKHVANVDIYLLPSQSRYGKYPSKARIKR